MDFPRFLLQAEVDFWRDLIERRRGYVSKETCDRMQWALALAERKLALVSTRH